MLTGFQLRAARGTLNIFREDLGKILGLHFITFARLERNTPNLSYLKCFTKTSLLLTNYFENNGLSFPNERTIAFKKNKNSLKFTISKNELTRFQLKAARIAMCLSQEVLGKHIGLAQSTISDLELSGDKTEFIKLSEIPVENIKSFFIQNGIIFPDQFSVEIVKDPIKNIKSFFIQNGITFPNQL